jgi:hypothetical protein
MAPRQVGHAELAQDGDHPVLDEVLVGSGSFPVGQDPADPLQRGLPVLDHAGGSSDRRKDLPDDPQARLGLPTPDHLGAHQPGEPVHAEPTGAGQVPVVAGHDHGQRGDPGGRLERLRGRLQRCARGGRCRSPDTFARSGGSSTIPRRVGSLAAVAALATAR